MSQRSTIRFIVLPSLPPLADRKSTLEKYENSKKVKTHRIFLNHTVKSVFFKLRKNLPPISSSAFLVHEDGTWQHLALGNRFKDLVTSPKDQLFVLIRKQLIGILRPERIAHKHSTLVVEKTNLSCSLLDFLSILDWPTLMNLPEFHPTRFYIKRNDSTYTRIDQDSKLLKGERVVAGVTFKYIDKRGVLQEYQVPLDLSLHQVFKYCKFGPTDTPERLYTLYLENFLDFIETYSPNKEDDDSLISFLPHQCAFISDDNSEPLTMAAKIEKHLERNELKQLLTKRTEILEIRQRLLQLEALHHRNVDDIFQEDIVECHLGEVPDVDWIEMVLISRQQMANAIKITDTELKLKHEAQRLQDSIDTFNQHLLNKNEISQYDRSFIIRSIIDDNKQYE